MRSRFWLSAVLVCSPLLFCPPACSPVWAAGTTLPPPLAQALQRYGVNARSLSIYVHEVGAAAPLLAFAADEPRQPASVMKVLTTLAALEELGPAYQWKTELWTQAPLRQGRLEGDLYIKGYGDPYLVVEHFWRLLRQLRQRGVTEIGGDLVVDQSYFLPDNDDPGEFDGRAERAYNVQPAALLVNFQAVNFRFIPDPAEQRLRIATDPWPQQLGLENRVKLTRERCRGWSSQLGFKRNVSADKVTLLFSGSYPAACGEHEMFRVVSEPLPYILGVFKTLWSEMGGRLEGGVREAAVPLDARLLTAIQSPPLADVIRSVNKYSNNVMSRQLLLTLGAYQGVPPGTTQNGIAAVRAWMKKRGFEFPELVLENGSGLSRRERISARHLGELLLAGYAGPSMPEFLSSLPISGLDGTLRNRLAGSPLEGRAHLKTGSINGVRTIAGFVLDRAGRRVAVVAMYNDPRAERGGAGAMEDAVLDWVYRRPGSAPGSMSIPAPATAVE